MKKKQKLLVALMALTLAGGVGSALAAVSISQGQKTNTAAFDSAIELNWGSGSSSASIGNLSNLQAGVSKYRTLEVTPKSSKSVAGTVTLTFKIDVGQDVDETDNDYSAEGLTLTVIETQNAATIVGMTTNASSEWINDTSYSGAGTETPRATLVGDKTDTTESFTFSVIAGQGVHETAKHYLLKFDYSGASVTSGKVFGGAIVVSQSFAA